MKDGERCWFIRMGDVRLLESEGNYTRLFFGEERPLIARSLRYLRYVYLVPGVLFAGVANVDRLWVFANLAVGSCAIPNLIAVLALSGSFFVLMQDYVSGENRYATAIIDASREYVQ